MGCGAVVSGSSYIGDFKFSGVIEPFLAALANLLRIWVGWPVIISMDGEAG